MSRANLKKVLKCATIETMKQKVRESTPTSVRLSDEGRALWEAVAKHFKISKAAALEVALRELAVKHNIKT